MPPGQTTLQPVFNLLFTQALGNVRACSRRVGFMKSLVRSTQVRATKWWISVEKKVLQSIRDGYIKRSREADSKSKDSFGNVLVSEKAGLGKAKSPSAMCWTVISCYAFPNCTFAA